MVSMPGRARGLFALAPLVLIVFAVAGCGGNVVDQGDLESQAVGQAKDAGLSAESASCPDDVSSDEGTTFQCTVTTADGDITANGTVEKETDSKALLSFTFEGASGATGAAGDQ
jgi:hypothetical protein